MTTESDTQHSGFLATVVFAGAFLTLTPIFAMQGLSLQSDEWEFQKKYAAIEYPELVATRTEQHESLKQIKRITDTTVAVDIDSAKAIVLKKLQGK